MERIDIEDKQILLNEDDNHINLNYESYVLE